ncbi:hypothetical protein KXW36_001143, partial [Aspergillus fumigatus]
MTIDVEFEPHPRLSPTQRSIIAREYGMTAGLSVIPVRRAMLFYLLDEMRLLKAIRQQDKDLAEVPVWVKNSKVIAGELNRFAPRRRATAAAGGGMSSFGFT